VSSCGGLLRVMIQLWAELCSFCQFQHRAENFQFMFHRSAFLNSAILGSSVTRSPCLIPCSRSNRQKSDPECTVTWFTCSTCVLNLLN
jgi:hypothetical protein